MWETSGSFVFVSGVGTQTLITSQRESSAKSVVACRRPSTTTSESSPGTTSSM